MHLNKELSIKYDGDALKIDGLNDDVIKINEIKFFNEEREDKLFPMVMLNVSFIGTNKYHSVLKFDLQSFREWLFKFFSISCGNDFRTYKATFNDNNYIETSLVEKNKILLSVNAKESKESKDFEFKMYTTVSEVIDLHELLKKISSMI